MYRIATSLIIVLFIALIQSTAFDYIAIAGIKPEVLLIFTIISALTGRRKDIIKIALFSGLLKDLTSLFIFGGYTFSFIIIGLAINYHQSKFYKERLTTQFSISAICYIIMGLIVLSFNSLAKKEFLNFALYFSPLIKGAIYTGGVSILAWKLLELTNIKNNRLLGRSYV